MQVRFTPIVFWRNVAAAALPQPRPPLPVLCGINKHTAGEVALARRHLDVLVSPERDEGAPAVAF